MLLAADYSQVELRVLAHVADEPVLKEIFIRGEDVHTATAREVFQVAEADIDPGMRSKAKMINYGIVYGLTDYGLADRLNIPREEAKEFIDAYLARFSSASHAFMTGDDRAGDRRGLRDDAVRAPPHDPRAARAQLPGALARRAAGGQHRRPGHGRRRHEARDDRRRARAARTRTCATRLILTIHDELLFEGPPEEMDAVRALAEREMVAPWGDREPPLAVDAGVGATWLEAK